MIGVMAEYTEAELINLKRAEPKKKPEATKAEKARFYGELLGYASGLGRKTTNPYQKGWVAHKFRAKHGHWPRGYDEYLIEPSKLTLAWIRSQQIRYAKQQDKRKAS